MEKYILGLSGPSPLELVIILIVLLIPVLLLVVFISRSGSKRAELDEKMKELTEELHKVYSKLKEDKDNS